MVEHQSPGQETRTKPLRTLAMAAGVGRGPKVWSGKVPQNARGTRQGSLCTA